VFLCNIKKTQAQVDSVHYIPPMASFTTSASNVDDHWMVLTTEETTAFQVTIETRDGMFRRVVNLSKTSPQKISLNYRKYNSSGQIAGRGVLSQGIIDGRNELNKILDNQGFKVSGSKKFFVSIQQKSSAQGDLLSSKGATGLGTDFYTGHMFSTQGNYDSHNGHFIGIMATENNTNITVSNPRMRFKGKSSNTFTFTLHKNQSYVIGISINDLKHQTSNLNAMNGTHIQSNKPISVSSGSMCASGSPNWGGNPGRDVGFDQLVPSSVVGSEYIIIKGEGLNGGAHYNEKACIVATEPNTIVKWYTGKSGGGSQERTAILNNKGDYVFTGTNDFINSTTKNMYIKADKKVFVYQTLSGANRKQTAGLCFIPPLKCTADKEVTISYANKLASLNVIPVLKLITQKTNPGLKLNGIPLRTSDYSSFDVPNKSDWKTYNIRITNSMKNYYNATNNWIFRVSSNNALNAMLAVESGNVGGGGFYSGFGDVPTVDKTPTLGETGLCGSHLILTASGFPQYRWYRNGIQISGTSSNTYNPSSPGRYRVTGVSPCGGSITESFPSPEIRIYPCLSIVSGDIEIIEGDVPNVVFRVEVSHPYTAEDGTDISFDYHTTAGTASGGVDFIPKSQSVTIPAGSSYFDIEIPIVDDDLNELDENFTLSITNVVGAVESINTASCTIKDNGDSFPVINIYDQNYNEGVGDISFELNLNKASGKTTSFKYQIIDATAKKASDYQAVAYSGVVSFNPGETKKYIQFKINDDDLYEPGSNEFFRLKLSDFNSIAEGNNDAKMYILDNEAVSNITVLDLSKTEGDDIVFRASLDTKCENTINFNYNIELQVGVDKAGVNDFTNYISFANGSVSIPANTSYVDFPAFKTFDDAYNEQVESFKLKLSANNHGSFVRNTIIGKILDNEGSPELSISNQSATEGQDMVFKLYVNPVSSTNLHCDYRLLPVTASSPNDFLAKSWTRINIPAGSSFVDIVVPTVQDTDEEGDETFDLELANPSTGLTISPGMEKVSGKIIDDDHTPVAQPDNIVVDEDSSVAYNVLNNDTGKEDAPVTVISNTSPKHGSLTMNSDGTILYTPNPNYNGNDDFKYTLRDADNDRSTAIVSIIVNPINDLPNADNDTYNIVEDTELRETVRANDDNLFDSPITYTLASNVKDGSLTFNSDGTFVYMPDSEFFGRDGFSYIVTDGNGDSSPASVIINVSFVNDAPPVAVDDKVSTNEDVQVSIPVLANDSDVDGEKTIDKASIIITDPADHGDLSINFITGEVVYKPYLNYTGSDDFRYTISDTDGRVSNQARVRITVTLDNDPPVALCKPNLDIILDKTGNYNLTASEIDNGSNDDSDHGTVSLSLSKSSFDCDDKGLLDVTLTVTDNDLASATCITKLNIQDKTKAVLKNPVFDIVKDNDTNSCGAVVNYPIPSFVDNCDGEKPGVLVQGLSSGSNFPVGTTVLKYSYTDASGNSSSVVNLNLTVRDIEKPKLNNISEKTVYVNSNGCRYLVSNSSLDITATDNCGVASISHNYDGGGASLRTKYLNIGTHDIEWTVEDIHGNISIAVVRINVKSKLAVSLVGPIGNTVCIGDNAVFIANGNFGKPAYVYKFLVNNTEVTSGHVGDTYTSSSLSNGDKVKVEITDSYSCKTESPEFIINVLPKPIPQLMHE
jgi:hypothetical protein